MVGAKSFVARGFLEGVPCKLDSRYTTADKFLVFFSRFLYLEPIGNMPTENVQCNGDSRGSRRGVHVITYMGRRHSGRLHVDNRSCLTSAEYHNPTADAGKHVKSKT